MSESNVEAIFIADRNGASMTPVAEANACAGLGLEGDRHYRAEGNEPDREITLIEAEAIEALTREGGIPFETCESRRNVVTRGVALNHLVGREFKVGEVRLKGMRFCEPCGHLEKLTRPGVMKGLVHRGGLRAQILDGGPIRVGDPVVTQPR
jgi:MOSC domain-containing protein YiiM